MVAVASAVAIGSVIAASYISPAASMGVVGVLILVAAVGWPHILGVPARKSQSTVIALSALGATAAALFTPVNQVMVGMPLAVALGIGAVFLIQLIRGTGQSHRLESTLGAGVGVLMMTLGSGWVAAERLAVNSGDSGLMLVTGISLLIALGAALLPWPDRIVAPLGVVLAALAGPLGAILLTDVPPIPAAVIGAVCGAVVVSARRLLLARETPLNVLAALAAGVAPILAVGSLVYFLAKLLAS